MAKKKKPVIDLHGRDLGFELDGQVARLLAYNPNSMTLQVNFYDGDTLVRCDAAFPFAHLPKPLKQALNPK